MQFPTLHDLHHAFGISGVPDPGIEICINNEGPATRLALGMAPEPASLDVPIGDDKDATLADLIKAPDAIDRPGFPLHFEFEYLWHDV